MAQAKEMKGWHFPLRLFRVAYEATIDPNDILSALDL
jgi:hypothetical protein